MITKCVIALFIVIMSSQSVTAQNSDRALGQSFEFESEILSGKRDVRIYVPEIDSPINNPQSTFPVVYVLDGEHNFINTVGISKVLARANLIPHLIVIGVTGANRELDYSPNDLKVDYMQTGGGKDFLFFITDELAPYIDANYPSSNHNSIIGHSLGALFSLYAFVENPSSFDGYLSISPSLWWDNQSLAKDWIKLLESHSPESDKVVYVTMANEKTMGEDGKIMHEQYLEYKARLKGGTHFEISFKDLFEEDHLSTVTPATHHGLKFLFQDWNLDRHYLNNDFNGLKKSLESLSEKYHFKVVPDYASLVNMGRFFHDKEEYNAAINIYEFGIEAYPNGLQLLGFTAQSYSQIGSIEKARETFERCLRVANSNNSPKIGRAHV